VKALDTNVLVRHFVDDTEDTQAARQRPAATAALRQPCWVAITVLLEFEWVLRGFYGFEAKAVNRTLRTLAGLEHVALEDRAAVLAAIDAHERGLDLADALHLARSGRASAMLTFDKKLAKRARNSGLPTPVELLG
jgi:predicted nucleic-acid-binding protein